MEPHLPVFLTGRARDAALPSHPNPSAPNPDLGGTEKAGHVPFASRIPVATGPFPAQQLLCPEDPVGCDVLRTPHWPRVHIIAGIAAESDQAPGVHRGAEGGVRGLLPQPQAQPQPPPLLTSSQSRC